MASSKGQNVIQREKNKKGNGTITKVQLISCYAVSALIVVLCIIEAMKPETIAQENQVMYYILAVVGVAFSVGITIRNNKAKKSAQYTGPRLK